MEPIITINEYPIGWEWLDKVPLEDFTWLIEIFSTMTDDTDTYDFATFDKEETMNWPDPDDQETFENNYSDNAMKTIAYIMSTYHIGIYDLDIRDILKSYIIARYYGWEPKEEDLEEIISHTSYFDININDAIYEVLTMPREK